MDKKTELEQAVVNAEVKSEWVKPELIEVSGGLNAVEGLPTGTAPDFTSAMTS